MVREAGLEPARAYCTLEPESSESANSTTRAFILNAHKYYYICAGLSIQNSRLNLRRYGSIINEISIILHEDADVETILTVLKNVLPCILSSIPFIVIWRIFKVRAMAKRRRVWSTTAAHEIGIVIFSIFLVGLASGAIVPRIGVVDGGIKIAVYNGMKNLNLKLFKVITVSRANFENSHSANYFIVNFLGNIGIFMPIGFFAILLFKDMPLWKAVLTGFLISLFIELCQLPTDRWTDIDDIWLNTLGTCLGGLAAVLMQKLFPAISSRFKVRGKG